MQPLNYCRSMVRQFSECLATPAIDDWPRQMKSWLIDLSGASQKFILPDGGKLLEDSEFKALDDDCQLRLPYPFVALEFREEEKLRIGGIDANIVFLRERDDDIAVIYAMRVRADAKWKAAPEFTLPKTGAIDRSVKSENGVRIRMKNVRGVDDPLMLQPGVVAALSFMNALACCNVRTSLIAPAKKKVKAALQFDSYHVLTIGGQSQNGDPGHGGSHRSPREHLRRGHIRRLADARRIWINATVVAAGRGAGVVSKDYAFRK